MSTPNLDAEADEFLGTLGRSIDEEKRQDKKKDFVVEQRGDQYCMSCEEVARELGITRQAVQQIEVRALRKLRLRLRKLGISLEA